MKSKVITGLVLALFSASMLTLAFNITLVKASSTIIVPDQYAKIQWAIGNATAGETIFIKAGTYFESVIVNKRVSLVGENKYNTIVDGGGKGTVIKILVYNVEVTSLTIRNSGAGDGISISQWSGVSSGNIIRDNIITNNSRGIYLEWSNNNIISGNNISNNKYEGLKFWHCTDNIVAGNILSNNQRGIYLIGHWENILANNTVCSNSMNGIYLSGTSNNIITGNVALNNQYGISLTSDWPGNNKLIDNTASFNSEAGISVNGIKGDSISGNNASNNIGIGIKLSGSNVYLSDNNVSNNGQDGIQISGQNHMLSGNTVINNNGNGIHLSGSLNKLFGNTISHNAHDGIWLWDLDDGIISDNIIIYNEDNGIYLAASSDSILFGNTISFNNGVGIVLLFTTDNRIFHNEFNSNAKSVNSTDSIDSWDNNGEGNYWSDYDGKDLDRNGIGDKPYIIDKNNRDNYPLMGKFSNFSISWEYENYHVTTICNSIISDFQFDGEHKRIRFNVTGSDGTAGFCRVTVPMNILKANATHPWKVLVDNIEINYTKAEKGNHTLIYFTYTHSTHKVQMTVEKLPPPFWMQWWFWAIAAVVIVALTGTIYFLVKKKPPISED